MKTIKITNPKKELKEEDCVEYSKNAHCEYSTKKGGCRKNCSHYYKKK